MSRTKSFDVFFKLSAIACAEVKSKKAAARELGVDGKQIHVWCSQKEAVTVQKRVGNQKQRDWLEQDEKR